MKEILNKISVFLFFTALCALAILTLLSEKTDFSEQENRRLTAFPKLSISTILDRSFMTEFEKYFSDNFFARTSFVFSKSRIESMTGKKEINGVYILPNKFLIKSNEIDQDIVDNNIKAINSFYEKNNMSVTLAIVPTAIEIYKDEIDANAPKPYQKKEIEKIYAKLDKKVQSVDLINPLYAAKSDYIYYKTDHHYTSLGAYITYNSTIKSLDVTPIPLEKWDIKRASDKFNGTLYSKTLLNPEIKDTIDLYTYPKGSKLESVISVEKGKQKETKSIFFDSFLNHKNKYEVFLGKSSYTKITTKLKNGKKLLIFRDSFGTSLMQFFFTHYEQITIIDLRMTDQKLDELKYSDFEKVLIVYSNDTFVQDKSLQKLTK
jgi:hypothetical protein